MSSFFLSELDDLSFEEILSRLNDLQVRYSVRKDTSREYLLQILKRHLRKFNETPGSIKIIETEMIREIHSQPRIQYPVLDPPDQMKSRNRFSVGGVSRNLTANEGLRNRAHTPQVRHTQGQNFYSHPGEQRKEYSPQPRSFLNSEQSKIPLSSAKRPIPDSTANKENIGRINFSESHRKNNIDFWHDEPKRRSLGCVGHIADIVEENRNCYSDTQLLKGPIEVDYRDFVQEKDKQTLLSPNRVNVSQNEINYRSPINPGNSSFSGNERMQMFSPVKIKEGGADGKWFWRVLTVFSSMIFLFYLVILLPNYLYGQRTPVV